ncbi:MAG TPA: hypothetical protein QGF05_12410 [Dehalococcoidia bacterium]|nr:hypothetical protein [Dehalococcoidia bacterium]
MIACGDLEPRTPLAPGAPDQQGPAAGTVRLFDFDGYDFSKGVPQEGGGDFYVDVDGPEPTFYANNAGQLGLIDLGDLGSASLDSVVVPGDGYSRFGVPMVEGNTYVARAVEAEVDHFIVFRIADLRLGDYVEMEFQYR